MKKIYSLLLLSFLITSVQAQAFKIVGYMPSWSGAAANIQYSKLTHINYSFVEPNSDGSGALNAVPNTAKLTSIVTLAHAANVKVFIAVGGWGDGNDAEWAAITASSAKINIFRNNIMALVWQYNLDGVDIDWEFPSNSTEATGFINLMTALSDTLHKANMKLSAAVIGQGATADYISPDTFDYIDWLNIMAYDNCCSVAHSSYSYGVNSLDYWLALGLPKAKAILGVPFYGKALNGGSSTTYASIINNNTANSLYNSYNNGSTDIYYNGIQMIKDKTTYAKANGGGIMIWELSQDAGGANIAYSLLTAINEVQPAVQDISTSVSSSVTFNSNLYPNPARDYVYVEAADASVKVFQYNVVDLSGKSLLMGVINSNSGEIPLSSLPQGMYVLHLKEGDKVSAIRLVKE